MYKIYFKVWSKHYVDIKTSSDMIFAHIRYQNISFPLEATSVCSSLTIFTSLPVDFLLGRECPRSLELRFEFLNIDLRELRSWEKISSIIQAIINLKSYKNNFHHVVKGPVSCTLFYIFIEDPNTSEYFSKIVDQILCFYWEMLKIV